MPISRDPLFKPVQRTVESPDFVRDTMLIWKEKSPKVHQRLLELVYPLIPQAVSRDLARSTQTFLQVTQPHLRTLVVPGQVITIRGKTHSVVYTGDGVCVHSPLDADPELRRLITALWSMCLLAQMGRTPTVGPCTLGRVWTANPAPLLLAQALREGLARARYVDSASRLRMWQAVAHLRALYRRQARQLARPTKAAREGQGPFKDPALWHTPAMPGGPALLRRELRLRLYLADPFIAGYRDDTGGSLATYAPLRADAARRAHAIKEFQ